MQNNQLPTKVHAEMEDNYSQGIISKLDIILLWIALAVPRSRDPEFMQIRGC